MAEERMELALFVHVALTVSDHLSFSAAAVIYLISFHSPRYIPKIIIPSHFTTIGHPI
jgi:hypothetical protein